MAAFKSFKSLVQLQHKEGSLYQVVGDSSKLPKWFHTEHLDDPKTMYVDARVVEMMFGKDGEYIPHVECVTRTLLHANQWNPEEEAEILIFGPPDYQKDVSQMISNLVEHFSKKTQEEDCSQETETQCLPEEVREAATQQAPVEDSDAATQQAPVEDSDAATQQAPVEDSDAATQLAPVEDPDATQLAPVEDSDATQLPPVEVGDAATQLGPVAVHEDASEAATAHT